MGRHGSGHRIFNTKAYEELKSSCERVCIDTLDVDDKFVHIGAHKSDFGVYKVKVIKEQRIRCVKLTPTGKESKRNSMRFSKTFDVFKANENIYDIVKDIHEQSKVHTVTKESGRDYQRSKVYRAEDIIRKAMKERIPVLTKTMADEYVGELYESYNDKSWWTQSRRIRLRENCRRHGAIAFPWGVIEYGDEKFGLNKMVLLHEVAHVANNCPNSHGAEFCGVYLALLSYEMPVLFEALKSQFDKKKIDYEAYV